MERDQVIATGRFVPIRGPRKPDRTTLGVERRHGVRERPSAKDVGEQPAITEEATGQIPIVDFGKSGFVGVVGGLQELLQGRAVSSGKRQGK